MSGARYERTRPSLDRPDGGGPPGGGRGAPARRPEAAAR